MDLTSYEMLVRRAFGLKNPEMNARWGDPAELANAGNVQTSDPITFKRVKAAAVYAMSVVMKYLEHKDMLTPDLEATLKSCIETAFDATGQTDLLQACDTVLQDVIVKYLND